MVCFCGFLYSWLYNLIFSDDKQVHYFLICGVFFLMFVDLIFYVLLILPEINLLIAFSDLKYAWLVRFSRSDTWIVSKIVFHGDLFHTEKSSWLSLSISIISFFIFTLIIIIDLFGFCIRLCHNSYSYMLRFNLTNSILCASSVQRSHVKVTPSSFNTVIVFFSSLCTEVLQSIRNSETE